MDDNECLSSSLLGGIRTPPCSPPLLIPGSTEDLIVDSNELPILSPVVVSPPEFCLESHFLKSLCDLGQLYFHVSAERSRVFALVKDNNAQRKVIQAVHLAERSERDVEHWKDLISSQTMVLRKFVEGYYDLMDILHNRKDMVTYPLNGWSDFEPCKDFDPSALETNARVNGIFSGSNQWVVVDQTHVFDVCVMCNQPKDVVLKQGTCTRVASGCVCTCSKDPYPVCSSCLFGVCVSQWRDNFIRSISVLQEGNTLPEVDCIISCPTCKGSICPYNIYRIGVLHINLTEEEIGLVTTQEGDPYTQEGDPYTQEGDPYIQEGDSYIQEDLSPQNGDIPFSLHALSFLNPAVGEEHTVDTTNDNGLGRYAQLINESLQDQYQILKVIQERVMGKESKKQERLPAPMDKPKRTRRCTSCLEPGHYAKRCPKKEFILKDMALEEFEKSVNDARLGNTNGM